MVSELQDKTLTKCSGLLSKVERSLFKDLYLKHKDINELKSSYIKYFNITARQFNSCRIKLEGKIKSYRELLKINTQLLEAKIKKLKKHLKNIKNSEKKHQKKRRLYALEKRLERLQEDTKANRIRICFGSKKLFKKQFFLEENGFSSFAEWKKKWKESRNNSFFLVGSKDETAGNQTCQIIKNEDHFNLHLRLPNCFSTKYITLEKINFSYGKKELLEAIGENEKRKKLKKTKASYSHFGKALTYLFKKDEKRLDDSCYY